MLVFLNSMAFKYFYNGFLRGASVSVQGYVNEDAEGFQINLQGGPITAPEIVGDIILHVNPRFDDNMIVRNTLWNGYWGCEEREGGLFFNRGQEFTLHINCELRGFKITVDNCPFIYYKHRLDTQMITHASVYGDIIIHQIDYQPPSVCQTVDGIQNIGVLAVPNKTVLHNGFNIGSQFKVFGQVRNDVEKFAINLVCGHHSEESNIEPTNVALHFNPRFDENFIVMNSMTEGYWDSEKKGNLILNQGDNFSVSIFCDYDAFKIFVNDTLYDQFSHRMDVHKITYAYIYGGVTLQDVCQ